jgi:hypothetical protein
VLQAGAAVSTPTVTQFQFTDPLRTFPDAGADNCAAKVRLNLLRVRAILLRTSLANVGLLPQNPRRAP